MMCKITKKCILSQKLKINEKPSSTNKKIIDFTAFEKRLYLKRIFRVRNEKHLFILVIFNHQHNDTD